MENKESDLENFKKEYEKLRVKYKLQDFMELAEEFDIEKAAEKESSFVLRDIRRVANDKISSYLHLFETIMNPGSAPMFIMAMVKKLNEADRKTIKEIYDKISVIEMDILKLDTNYSEQKEADFIKTVFDQWKEIKKDITKILEKLSNKSDSESNNNSRGYFG